MSLSIVDSIFVQRDLALIVTATLAVIVFYGLRVQGRQSIRTRVLGRRVEDLDNFSRILGLSDERVKVRDLWWDVASVSSWNVPLEEVSETWKIELFSVEQLFSSQDSFASTEEDFYTLASGPDEADQLLMPLIRKIIGKYRDGFTKHRSIIVERGDMPDSLTTWLPTEIALRSTTFELLDDILSMARICNVSPSMTISVDKNFIVQIFLPDTPNVKTFATVMKDRAGIDLQTKEGEIVLELWLAFPGNQIPYHVFVDHAPRMELDQSA